LVFDEADRLFEMGVTNFLSSPSISHIILLQFAEQLNEIMRACATERQTLLFSATMPKQLVQFTRAGLRDPQFVRLEADVSLSTELRLAFFLIRSNEKV
jgi:ATP-dependent RNA helicase DDX54/DBP10